MVGFILACLGHRYRAVAGSNPALPTNFALWTIVFSQCVVAENPYTQQQPTGYAIVYILVWRLVWLAGGLWRLLQAEQNF